MKIPALEKLLQKEMDRKEFLLYLGMFFLVLTGISGMWRRLHEAAGIYPSKKPEFGYGPYGGVQEGEKK